MIRPERTRRTALVGLLATFALAASACSAEDPAADSSAAISDTTLDDATAEPAGDGAADAEGAGGAANDSGAGADDDASSGADGLREAPPRNPFLADSVVPVGHFDSAQTDSVAIAGPTGPTAALGAEELEYAHLGPAHFGIAISPPYPDGRRVIWSNGGDRISKLDHDTLDVLAELPIPGRTLQSAEQADADLARLDSLSGVELAAEAVTLATQYLVGLAGVYYLLDADNTLFVGGAESIIAYRDVEAGDPTSAIEVRDEWIKPDEIGGSFVGANLTFDGRIAMVTDEGWLVLVTRDFADYDAITLVGAEGAAAHNQAMADAGVRPGRADWVRNSIAIDDEGGIYVVSFEHMHKVVWDGEDLSTDPSDGAWTDPYLNGTAAGSGATPSLMGFGDEDRFVVITDGEELMNVVMFWRDEIPDDWQQLAGAPSRRIAGQAPADMGDPDRTAIQTEQSVVVAGYGALVVDNEPASIPPDFPPLGVRVLVAYAGADPMFTPHGMQKFAWDPRARTFRQAWVNTEVSSANSVPVVSTGSNLVYTVGARNGMWGLEAVDWDTGAEAFHWTTGSNRYNSLYSGINLDQDGRVVHTTAFGIVRYRPAG